MRKMSFSLAINEALHQMMAQDTSVFLIGQGVKSPWYVGNAAQGLLERFGEKRVIDTPVSTDFGSRLFSVIRPGALFTSVMYYSRWRRASRPGEQDPNYRFRLKAKIGN